MDPDEDLRISYTPVCTGEGRCHGCVAWCDECGNVSTMCNFPSCNAHHCVGCQKLLTSDEHEHNIKWFKWCRACWIDSAMREALLIGRDEIAAAERAEREWLATAEAR